MRASHGADVDSLPQVRSAPLPGKTQSRHAQSRGHGLQTVQPSRVIGLALLGTLAIATMARAAENNSAPPSAAAVSDVELTPYDAGYASQASEKCPGLALLATVNAETKASDQFKRGQDMFTRYVELQKLEGACKAALNLYNDKTGKAAKVLRPN